jgi:hypothetical protein
LAALDQGATVRRGQGYTLRVTTVPAVHHQLLACCQPLDGGPGAPAVPAQRKARRECENRQHPHGEAMIVLTGISCTPTTHTR